jgi:hypothetical protein
LKTKQLGIFFAIAAATLSGIRPIFAQTLGEVQQAQANKHKDILFVNNQSSAADVNIAFGADSVINVMNLAGFCEPGSSPPLNCHFTLDANEQKELPNPNFKYVNMAVSFNHSVSCNATKAEVIANNPAWYDIQDVSVVDGFNNKIQITVDPGPRGGSTLVIGPPVGLSGNQKIFGVYPFACTICTGIRNAPCGDNGPSECHAGTEANPDPPCQYQMNNPDGTIIISLQP